MKITYLGQAGLLFETEAASLLVDPYLSNSVEKVNPRNYRRCAIDERYLNIRPDIILCTHDHLDHYDEETLVHYLGQEEKPICLLTPYSAWQKAKAFGNGHNYVMFNRGTVWTERGFRIMAVRAEHSDIMAIGAIVEAEGMRYYITGDTLYNEQIFCDLPDDIDVLFLPVNGLGNNMNMQDGARFAARVNARYTVPYHVGMFDEMRADDFCAPHACVIPKIYQEIVFD